MPARFTVTITTSGGEISVYITGLPPPPPQKKKRQREQTKEGNN